MVGDSELVSGGFNSPPVLKLGYSVGTDRKPTIVIPITHDIHANGPGPVQTPLYPRAGDARNLKRPFFIIGVASTLRRILPCQQATTAKILFRFNIGSAGRSGQ